MEKENVENACIGVWHMAKNRVEVVINGNIMSLQGDASEEHIQKVAKIINEKLGEINRNYNKTHVPTGKVNQLLVLNLADEYVKKQEELAHTIEEVEAVRAENKALREQIDKLMVEVANNQKEIAASTEHKHTQKNRGR